MDDDKFRPENTFHNFKWLSSLDIKNTMERYENKYKDFKYLGSFPIDFADIPFYEINNINFDELIKNGKNKLALFFNSGSTWTSLFIDFNNEICYYFDSICAKPDSRISNFIDKITKFMKDTLNIKPFSIKYNKTEHNNCSYCAYCPLIFIIKLLEN